MNFLKYKKSFAYLFLLIACFFNYFAQAKQYPEIQACSEAGFFPFEMRTTTGKWDGYEIALMTQFAKDSGRKIKMVDMKFDGLIPALIANKGCDVVVSAVGVNAEREKIVSFSLPTYQSAYAGIIRTTDVSKLTSFLDLNKKGIKIAVQQGTESAQYVKKYFTNTTILNFDDNSVPISAVITKKADVYIDDSVYASIAVKRKVGKISLLNPKIFPANQADDMAFVFRKSDTKFRDEFNGFFKKIQKNGELKKLQKSYFEEMDWVKDFPENK